MVTYSANITAGALRLRESRILAGLLLDGVSGSEWERLVYQDNALQMKYPASSRRIARLLGQRLALLGHDAWSLIRDGSREESIQILFVAAMAHSQLLLDFVDLVVRDHFLVGAETLPKYAWVPFLEQCEARDPEVASWSESTREKVRQVCYTILSEVGYLSDTRKLLLQNVRILPKVKSCLVDTQAQDALRYMEVCS